MSDPMKIAEDAIDDLIDYGRLTQPGEDIARVALTALHAAGWRIMRPGHQGRESCKDCEDFMAVHVWRPEVTP